MRNIFQNKKTIIFIISLFAISSCISASGINIKTNKTNEKQLFNFEQDVKYIEYTLEFSEPEFDYYNNSFEEYIIVKVSETNHNMVIPGKPVLPTNYSVFEFPFGTKINHVTYESSTPQIINLSGQLSFGLAAYDSIGSPYVINKMGTITEPYPNDWIFYHTGGGILEETHTTFLVVRTFPVRYYQDDNQLSFIETITINISYTEPELSVLENNNYYDLLIIAPSQYFRYLRPLVCHKESHGVKTRLVTTNKVYKEMHWKGQDKQEKIKYYIKTAIEEWGVKHVLLVGGIKGQTNLWDLPIRYSHVVPPDEQEYAEQSFISDLYYADIYDSEGAFSSWDSNGDGVYSVWNDTYREQMDLYPDVYLGRLPCRTISEVKIMVNKIIKYEKERVADEDWFKNLILVAGDSYHDPPNQFNEGELISEEAKNLAPDLNPVEVYAREGSDINRRTVNKAMNDGASFAYFCGHGSPMSWSTHYPPDGINWTTGYLNRDMVFLRNGKKLPIAIVGGCHNGQFDVTFWNFIRGFLTHPIEYMRWWGEGYGEFWNGEWTPNCWAWMLTSKLGGGTIATIANTGLGTHGYGDQDNNSIADYLEVLDGWLELRFLELYGIDGKDILGQNHGDTMTGYLHKFLGDDAKMDVKMVQQWELFGDPSLKIGGYE